MHKTKEQISYNMQQVKSKDTKIEVMLRKELWARGLRYQKNSKKYSESPILFLSVKRLRYFATVNFGTDTIGTTRTKNSSLIKIFGFLKSREIWLVTKRLPKHSKIRDGLC